jgi:hypothetical protein
MAETQDLVKAAIEKNPIAFNDAFRDLMAQRAEAALEAHKINLAKSIYNGEDDVDLDDEDFDFSDDELEDIDFDDLDDGDFTDGEDTSGF